MARAENDKGLAKRLFLTPARLKPFGRAKVAKFRAKDESVQAQFCQLCELRIVVSVLCV